MKARFGLAVLVGMLLFPSHAFAGDPDPRTHASWWIGTYGNATSKDDPRVARAAQVFSRVSASADKNGKRFPRLLVLRSEGAPYAVAILDGSIVLTHGAIRLCYDGVEPEAGDSRLAFILGHELAHQAKDDYWHMAAFSAVREFSNDKAAAEGLIRLLKDTADLQDTKKAREVAKMKELQADAYGIVYMTMAGFDPGAIVGPNGKNFFQEWVLQITGRIAYEDKDHPGPAGRAEFARTQLASVVDDLGYFRFGVRLYQLGRYDDAVLMLEKFRERFPSREVYNDIGLCYYKLATRALSRCDDAVALRFRSPTVLDVETLGSRIELRGGGRETSSCRQSEQFVKWAKEASENLRLAAEKDPFYLAARINLASVHILTGDYSRAMAEADQALELEPGNASALSDKAVALYLFGVSSGIDTAENALSMLNSLSSPEALYNRAGILAERGRNSAAQEAVDAFLKIEPDGPYASSLRKRMGMNAPTAAARTPAAMTATAPKSPIALGELTPASREKLRQAKKKEFNLGGLGGTIFESGTLRVFVVDDSVEIVESDLEPPVDLDEFREKQGKPSRMLETSSGRTHIYSDFVADEAGGKITRIAYFTNPVP